jgi:hypothetical protein
MSSESVNNHTWIVDSHVLLCTSKMSTRQLSVSMHIDSLESHFSSVLILCKFVMFCGIIIAVNKPVLDL